MSLNIESHNTRRSLTFDRSFRKETVYLDTRIFVLLLFQKGFLSLSIYIYILTLFVQRHIGTGCTLEEARKKIWFAAWNWTILSARIDAVLFTGGKKRDDTRIVYLFNSLCSQSWKSCIIRIFEMVNIIFLFIFIGYKNKQTESRNIFEIVHNIYSHTYNYYFNYFNCGYWREIKSWNSPSLMR